MIASRPQSASPRNNSTSRDDKLSSLSREAKEPAQITKDYVWWCAVYHGAPLSADDLVFYHKAAILLAVMAGVTLPEFVIELLNKARPSTASPLSEARREINEEIIRKIETVRRMASHASRRTFALLTAEIMTTLYKIFHDVVAGIPDEEVEKSMIDLSVNNWGNRATKAPAEEVELQLAVDSSSFSTLGNPSMLPDSGSLWTVKPIIPVREVKPSIASHEEVLPSILEIPPSPPAIKLPNISSSNKAVPLPLKIKIKSPLISENIPDVKQTSAASTPCTSKAAPVSPTVMTSFTPTLSAALARAGMAPPTNATARRMTPPSLPETPVVVPKHAPTRKVEPRVPFTSTFPESSERKHGANEKNIETQFTLKAIVDVTSEVGYLCPVESSMFVMQEPIVDSAEMNKDDTSKEHFCKVRKSMRRVGRRVLKLVGSRPASPVRCENCNNPTKKSSSK